MPTGETQVKDLTHEEERELLDRLVSRPPAAVFAASDLHLGIGRDPKTGAYSLMENFLADEAAGRWVAHHRPQAAQGALLVLIGDIFDFLRIHQYPQSDADYAAWAERLVWLGEGDRASRLERPIRGSERKFGLRTHDYRTLWKLLLIFRGHLPFFKALATWVEAGGALIIVKGNHDVELHWPLVRRAIRDELVRRGAAADAVNARVAFADADFTLGNLYFEHGHQYEEMTRVVGGPTLGRDPTQINFPLGSFVNRYFINRIERLNPFIDNIKPVQQALLALLRRRPLTFARIYLQGWRFVWRAVTMRRFNGSVALILAGLVVPPLTIVLIAVFFVWPEAAARLAEWIPLLQNRGARIGGAVGGLLFPALLPYVVGAVRETLRQLGLLRKREHLVEGASGALRRAFPDGGGARRVYAVMGHTHTQDVRPLSATSREEYYVNVGTWVPVWPEGRPDLVGRVIYTFVRFDKGSDGEYRHRALEWDDQALDDREARIRVSPERGGR